MVTFLGRRAWCIENDQLRVTILECGGHVAEIVYKPAGDLNPLWIQDRPTIDSDEFDPALHGHIYGTDAEARLISGLMGHSLCMPFWGTPSASEAAAGMTYHGESNILRWENLEAESDLLRLGVTMLNCSIYFQREIRFIDNVIYFTETAKNLSTWDRPIGWCEHVSFGPPFLEAGYTHFAANLTRGFRTGDETLSRFEWPEGRGTEVCVLTEFSHAQHHDLVNSFLIDETGELGYFVAWNTRQCLLIGYVFLLAEFPWMNVWEDHTVTRRTRGMEFSNTPVDGTLKQLMRQPEIWGVPTCDWLNAKGTLRKSYAAFATSIPGDFKGVAHVSIVGGKLIVGEAETSNALVLKWAPPSSHGMYGLQASAESA